MKLIPQPLRMLPGLPFWTYFTAALFFNFGFSVFFFLFNLYLVGQGRDERSLGIIGSAMALGSLCGTLPAGVLAQRLGIRSTLMGGVALAVAASCLRVCLPSVVPQLIFAVLAGVALCTWAVCLPPAVAALTTDQQRPFAFSLIFASGIGDAGLGSLAAGHLPGWLAHLNPGAHITQVQAERMVLLCGCGIALCALLPLSRLQVAGTVSISRRLAMPSPTFLTRLFPAILAWSLVTSAFPPFATIYFVKHLGFTLPQMSSVFSLAQAFQFAAILIVPFALRSMTPTGGVVITQLVTAAALCVLGATHTGQHASWLYWLYMSAQYSNEPGFYAVLMNTVPDAERATVSSLTFFTSACATIVSSSAVGFAILHFGYAPLLYSLGALAVLAAVFFRRLAQ